MRVIKLARIKICVFTYDHPHPKTTSGLSAMWLHGFEPLVIWAAPWVGDKIEFDYAEDPRLFADKFGCEYKLLPHNEDYDPVCHFGVILGARILPQHVIDKFPCGVINIHPGRLPGSGGLKAHELEYRNPDSGKITAHFIDSRIDKGYEIIVKDVKKYKPETFDAFYSRVMAMQNIVLIEAIKKAAGVVASGRDYKNLFKRVK